MDFSTNTAPSELLLTIHPTKKNSFLLFHAFGRTIWMYLLAAWFGLPAVFIILGLTGTGAIISAIALFFIIWGISFLISRMQLNNIEYRFYNNKVEYSDGFLVKSKKNIPYAKITNTEQWQGIVERIFSLGHIYIDTAGTGGHEVIMNYLDSSEELYEKMNHIIQSGSK